MLRESKYFASEPSRPPLPRYLGTSRSSTLQPSKACLLINKFNPSTDLIKTPASTKKPRPYARPELYGHLNHLPDLLARNLQSEVIHAILDNTISVVTAANTSTPQLSFVASSMSNGTLLLSDRFKRPRPDIDTLQCSPRKKCGSVQDVDLPRFLIIMPIQQIAFGSAFI